MKFFTVSLRIKKASFFLFIVVFFSSGCQKDYYLYSKRNDGTVDPDYWLTKESITFTNLTTMHQSMDFYNGLGLFVGQSGINLVCDIFDVNSRSNVASLTLPINDFPIPHANTSCLSSSFYSSSSVFPLLYVSSWNGNRFAFVYDIYNFKGSYKSELVQVIDPSNISESIVGAGFLDWVVDSAGRYLYSISYKLKNSARIIEGNSSHIVKYALPSISSSYVSLTDEDVIDFFEIPVINVSQDKCFYEGHLLVVSGMPNSGGLFPNSLFDIDLSRKSILQQNIPYNGEPEGFCAYHGKLLFNMYRSSSVFIMNRF